MKIGHAAPRKPCRSVQSSAGHLSQHPARVPKNLCTIKQMNHLALQAQAQVVLATHSGLIDADPETAIPCWKWRGHDLLHADHVPEQPKVVHPPCELATA